MATIEESVRRLANGEPVSDLMQLIWGVHDGIRGATWTIVQQDGAILERRYISSPAGDRNHLCRKAGSVSFLRVRCEN
jgi:hypothetical protein